MYHSFLLLVTFVTISLNISAQDKSEFTVAPDGSGDSRDKTAFYAEYGNTGPGSAIGARGPWSRQLNKNQAKKYTRENILGPTSAESSDFQKWITGEK